MSYLTTFPTWCLIGFACFAPVTLLQLHPTRRRVWTPIGWFLLFAASLVALNSGQTRLVGFFGGAGLMAIAASSKTRASDAIAFFGIAFSIALITGSGDWEPVVVAVLAAVSGTVCIATVWYYRRPVGETLGECVFRLMYRMRVIGPGVEKLPRNGPVLVIANHSAYLDPCWVMICLPRDLTPIMFGDYFKKFGLHFYMKHIINAIPSGVGTVRRETPELDEAIRRLDLGEGLIVFPEGWVRRKEEEPIRRFAQGPWRVLRDRPATPVVACWIEGGWGSWSSFWNGPPFKNKRFDIRRPINIGVSVPVVVDKELLNDPMRTREHLKQMVLDARRHLGLPPIAGFGLAEDGQTANGSD
jgi:1-acyl-sn-glycerol-3-phosphate acyltransferase